MASPSQAPSLLRKKSKKEMTKSWNAWSKKQMWNLGKTLACEYLKWKMQLVLAEMRFQTMNLTLSLRRRVWWAGLWLFLLFYIKDRNICWDAQPCSSAPCSQGIIKFNCFLWEKLQQKYLICSFMVNAKILIHKTLFNLGVLRSVI